MRNRKDSHGPTEDLIRYRIREMLEVVASNAGLIFWPVSRCIAQAINRIKQLDSKCIGSDWTSIEIPEERLARSRLRFGQNFTVEGTHRVLRRCRTPAHGAACTRPARRSSRRRFTSTRHNSDTDASSAVSRLSRRATAKAERSSTGSPRTASNRWSTWAFMTVSLAPRGQCGKSSTDNISIDPDTRRPRLRRAIVCRSFLRHIDSE